jgi:hypothetical protein
MSNVLFFNLEGFIMKKAFGFFVAVVLLFGVASCTDPKVRAEEKAKELQKEKYALLDTEWAMEHEAELDAMLKECDALDAEYKLEQYTGKKYYGRCDSLFYKKTQVIPAQRRVWELEKNL